MINKIINNLIYSLFVFGIYGTGSLGLTEFHHSGTCPKIGIIPACYIIFICLILPFVTHILNKGKVLYFVFTSLALAIATYGTVGQLLGNVQCPKTTNGLPMCYISFVLFTSLIILKKIHLKTKS
jgi:hypothetical protein